MSFSCGSNNFNRDSHDSQLTCSDTSVRSKLGSNYPFHAKSDFNTHQKSISSPACLGLSTETFSRVLRRPDLFWQTRNHSSCSWEASRCLANTTRASKVERMDDTTTSTITSTRVKFADKANSSQNPCRQQKLQRWTKRLDERFCLFVVFFIKMLAFLFFSFSFFSSMISVQFFHGVVVLGFLKNLNDSPQYGNLFNPFD